MAFVAGEIQDANLVQRLSRQIGDGLNEAAHPAIGTFSAFGEDAIPEVHVRRENAVLLDKLLQRNVAHCSLRFHWACESASMGWENEGSIVTDRPARSPRTTDPARAIAGCDTRNGSSPRERLLTLAKIVKTLLTISRETRHNQGTQKNQGVHGAAAQRR